MVETGQEAVSSRFAFPQTAHLGDTVRNREPFCTFGSQFRAIVLPAGPVLFASFEPQRRLR